MRRRKRAVPLLEYVPTRAHVELEGAFRREWQAEQLDADLAEALAALERAGLEPEVLTVQGRPARDVGRGPERGMPAGEPEMPFGEEVSLSLF